MFRRRNASTSRYSRGRSAASGAGRSNQPGPVVFFFPCSSYVSNGQLYGRAERTSFFSLFVNFLPSLASSGAAGVSGTADEEDTRSSLSTSTSRTGGASPFFPEPKSKYVEGTSPGSRDGGPLKEQLREVIRQSQQDVPWSALSIVKADLLFHKRRFLLLFRSHVFFCLGKQCFQIFLCDLFRVGFTFIMAT